MVAYALQLVRSSARANNKLESQDMHSFCDMIPRLSFF